MTAAKRLQDDPGPRPWYVTSDEYWRLVEAGVLEGQRVQLIKGVIVEMSPMQEPHAVVVSRLNRWFSLALGMSWSVRVQLPLDVGADSVPEPDFAVLTVEDEERRFPQAPQTAPFVCEVSDSSLRFDRVEKLPIYAAARVAEYVIANIKQRSLEVYTGPTKSGYRKKRLFDGQQLFASAVLPGVTLRPDDVFARLGR
jgi:Uma2 family endonuclease